MDIPACLSTCLSVNLFVFLSVYLSIGLCVFLFVLPVCPPIPDVEKTTTFDVSVDERSAASPASSTARLIQDMLDISLDYADTEEAELVLLGKAPLCPTYTLWHTLVLKVQSSPGQRNCCCYQFGFMMCSLFIIRSLPPPVSSRLTRGGNGVLVLTATRSFSPHPCRRRTGS